VTRARVRVELTSGRWRIHNRFPHADWSIVDLWLARKLLGMHVSSAQEEAILRLGSPEFPRITATAFGLKDVFEQSHCCVLYRPAVNEVTRPWRKEWLPCIGMLLHRVETIVRSSALNAT
jgi:hypothetical protein